jgi:DNA/RNA-binding domain of Phe-tRNA-synthetase-like protein
MKVSIDPGLAGKVALGVVVLEGVQVRESDPDLQAEVQATTQEMRRLYGGGPSAEVPGAADSRALYKALGIDPTKTRPSSEALLRRVLKGEALYRVNTLVDALNLASLRLQLSFGLYDLDHVRPPVVLRKGREGESYPGIRKGPVGVADRPVLVDAEGPFGNPTSDSARTCVTASTRTALVVAYAPGAWSDTRVLDAVVQTQELMTRFCGGTTTERQVVR